jgi:hypothetical protein
MLGPGGAVDPAGTAVAVLVHKLPTKNEQLAVDGHRRIILIVNWSRLVTLSDLINACSTIAFSRYDKIDQIYFEESPGRTHRVYDRRLFSSRSDLDDPAPEIEILFVEWLGNRLTQLDEEAFRHVQKLATTRKSLAWLPPASREQLVAYGERFLQRGDWDRVQWIIAVLKDDPDPSIENSQDDPEGQFNEHKRLESGERSWLIHSVRGRLCWLLQKIVVLPKTD